MGIFPPEGCAYVIENDGNVPNRGWDSINFGQIVSIKGYP